MESAQGRNPIQWVTGTGLDIKDREKRISAKRKIAWENNPKGSFSLVLCPTTEHCVAMVNKQP